MKFLSVLILSLASSSLLAEVPDTIKFNEIRLKSNLNYVIETVAESNYTISINEILSSNSDGLNDEAGDQDDWFEIYNYGDLPVLLDSLYFSDKKTKPSKWQYLPSSPTWLAAKTSTVFWADNEAFEGEKHTNFKLSSDGEEIIVSTKDLVVIDEVEYPSQLSNTSYGRFPDGGEIFNTFTSPSPSQANSFSDIVEFLPQPNSNTKGGIYSKAQELILSTDILGAKITYTLDCSTPTVNSVAYEQAIHIDETTIVRAKLFKEGAIESETLTLSFIITTNEYNNNVLSLVSDADNFTGPKGIFARPNSDIEIPAQFEYFEDNVFVYKANTGIKIHSPKSTKQYSMRLYARGNYGDSWFDYPFFDDNAPKKFKRLILRNAGNDNLQKTTANTHCRDQIIQSLAKQSNRNALTSAAKPVNVYVNGKYYGVYNLRERIDKYYIDTHIDVDGDFDLLERCFGYGGNRNAIEGDYTRYLAEEKEVYEMDLRDDDSLALVAPNYDMDNFMDYWITEVFVGNYDWLSNNIKMFSSENLPWRWIYWDTDHGIGLKYGSYGYPTWNTLAWSLGEVNRAGGNNKLIKGFFSNESYKEEFVKRFVELLNTSFASTNTIAIADSITLLYESDMDYHIARWGSNQTSRATGISDITNYFTQRPDIVRGHIKSQFGLSSPVDLEISVSPPNAGVVQIDNCQTIEKTLSGTYFPDYKYSVAAEAKTDYIFKCWEGISTDVTSNIDFIPSEGSLVAVFERCVTGTDDKMKSIIDYYITDGELVISNVDSHPEQVSVYALDGKFVSALQVSPVSSNSWSASVGHLPHGIYIVKCQSVVLSYSAKVIIP